MTPGTRFILVILSIAQVSLALASEPVNVTAERLDSLLIDKELRAPASVISANEAVVTAEVAALISTVLRDVGDEVSKGDLLMRLDSSNARLALAQANAGLAAVEAQIIEARSRLENAEELLDKNFISDEELIARQAAVAVLEANLQGQKVAVERAQLDNARTRIKAPFNAVIVERQAQVGSYAQVGTPLMKLVQTDNREIDVELDPRYIAKLSTVKDIHFVSQGKRWPVKLARLSSVIETSARIVRGRFTFTDAQALIGTSGQLEWKALTGVLPVDLIVQRDDEFGVFTADAGTAKFIPLPGVQQGRPAAVNLPGETLIVVRGHNRLQDGDAIDTTSE